MDSAKTHCGKLLGIYLLLLLELVNPGLVFSLLDLAFFVNSSTPLFFLRSPVMVITCFPLLLVCTSIHSSTHCSLFYLVLLTFITYTCRGCCCWETTRRTTARPDWGIPSSCFMLFMFAVSVQHPLTFFWFYVAGMPWSVPILVCCCWQTWIWSTISFPAYLLPLLCI